MRAHLDRVLTELLRRGVATDLVPDWWPDLAPHAAAEAGMRTGWPPETALVQRIRELEDALHLSQLREDEAHLRRLDAERSRDEWASAAKAAEPDQNVRRALVDPEIAPAYDRAGDDARRRLRDEADRELSQWRDRATALARLARSLPRLPVKPARLHPGVLAALVWAVRPAQADPEVTHGEAAALPDAVVSEACRLLVESEVERYRRHAEIVGGRFDEAKFRAGAETWLGTAGDGRTGSASPREEAAP
jgi:hypothetical protein